jgi:dihydroflavonol-4-reductase
MYTEEDWSDFEACYSAYDKSKVLAEKAAWEFHASLSDSERFDLVTLIPGLILGPGLVQGEFSSMNYLRMIVLGFMPAYPDIRTPLVDIRDLAQAHL